MTESRKSWSMKIQSLSPGGFWITAVSASAVVVAAVSGVAVWFLLGTSWWVGWRPVLLAVIAAWMVPVFGLVPLLWADRAKPVKLAQVAQLSNALRLGTAAVLALLILLALSDSRGRIAFGVWMVGLYVVSLAVEMTVLVVWLRARPEVTRV